MWRSSSTDQDGYYYLHLSISPSHTHRMPVWQRTNFSFDSQTWTADVHVRQLFLLRKKTGAASTPEHLTCATALNHNWELKHQTDRQGMVQYPETQGGPIPETGQQLQSRTQDRCVVKKHNAGCQGNGRSVVHVQVMIMSNGSHHSSGWKCWNYSGFFMHIERFWVVSWVYSDKHIKYSVLFMHIERLFRSLIREADSGKKHPTNLKKVILLPVTSDYHPRGKIISKYNTWECCRNMDESIFATYINTSFKLP